MAEPGFLNQNESRAYPLVDGAAARAVPEEALVDFGCLLGLDAGFDDRMHAVALFEVRLAGDGRYEFDFRCDAPGLVDYALVFRRDPGDPEFATSRAAATPLGTPAPAPGCPPQRDDLLWEGYLTTGLLDTLAAALAAGTPLPLPAGPPAVEPALAQNLARGFVRTLNLANEDRTRAHPPAGCSVGVSEAFGDLPVREYTAIVNRECLHGPLVLREGFNVSIRQNARDSSLTIAAHPSAGAGAPCDEVPLTDAERPPAGSTLLTGGPSCSDVIGGINGLSAAALELVPLAGVRIAPSTTDPHTLIVDVDLHDLTICPPPPTPAALHVMPGWPPGGTG
jgi:hypothetical protein